MVGPSLEPSPFLKDFVRQASTTHVIHRLHFGSMAEPMLPKNSPATNMLDRTYHSLTCKAMPPLENWGPPPGSSNPSHRPDHELVPPEGGKGGRGTHLSAFLTCGLSLQCPPQDRGQGFPTQGRCCLKPRPSKGQVLLKGRFEKRMLFHTRND